MNYRRAALCCLVLCGIQTGMAQDLSERLSKLAVTNGANYVSPIIAGWGADLNSGFYHSADLHDILGFDVQLKLSAARLSEGDKFFNFEMPDTIQITQGPGFTTLVADRDYPKRVKTATVIGRKEETSVRTFRTTNTAFQEIEIARLPGGFDIDFPVVGSAAPLFVPQAAIGLPFGIEVIGRFIPTTTITAEGTDVGKVNFLGFGVRYDIDQHIPLMPVDIAVHFTTQKFNLMDTKDNNLISATATAYGVEASYKLLLFTLYGGFQLETSAFEIGPYTATVQYGNTAQEIRDIKFTVDGKNSSRALVGLRFLLAFVNIHADYSFATTPVLTVGAGILLR